MQISWHHQMLALLSRQYRVAFREYADLNTGFVLLLTADCHGPTKNFPQLSRFSEVTFHWKTCLARAN